jgi:hypothetical protein
MHNRLPVRNAKPQHLDSEPPIAGQQKQATTRWWPPSPWCGCIHRPAHLGTGSNTRRLVVRTSGSADSLHTSSTIIRLPSRVAAIQAVAQDRECLSAAGDRDPYLVGVPKRGSCPPRTLALTDEFSMDTPSHTSALPLKSSLSDPPQQSVESLAMLQARNTQDALRIRQREFASWLRPRRGRNQGYRSGTPY